MLFNSIEFLFFFPAVLALYFLLGHRGQNVMLLAASYLFYGWWDWRFLGLIFVSTLIDYAAALAIARWRGTARARVAVVVSVVANLGILGFFKYFGFFVENLQAVLAAAGAPIQLSTLEIILPVGISFYTFQTMSYTIDVYRGDLDTTRDFVAFALFVSFFPQLVAGPIVRASELLPQVEQDRRVTGEDFREGLRLIGWGLFKKVFIADNLAVHVVDPILDPSLGLGGVTLLLGIYGFALQIYCDFSGYSDVAVGSARCMGFRMRPNFDLPYFATSPKEFWAGWHISLSTWLRDYLYVPLGGNRGGHTHRNLILTMLLGGLWHGAAWKFIVWGAYHGALLVWFRRRPPMARWPWALRVVAFFHFTCLGWLIFRARDLSDAGRILRSVVLELPLFYDPDLVYLKSLLFYGGPLILIQLAQYFRRPRPVIDAIPVPIRGLVYAAFFYLFIVFGEFGGKEFIYFQF